jgi:hypothetical protein
VNTRRLFVVALLLAALVASAGGAAAGAGGALEVFDGTSMSGYPVGSSGPHGADIRFIDRGSFWIAVLVRNRTARPVTLLGAHTPEPDQSLVRQTRVGFSAYTPCPGQQLCPWPSGSNSPRPLTLAPHEQAAIKLSYQLVSCAQAASSTLASGRSLILSYRVGRGQLRQETVALRGARLHLRQPAGVECLQRPFSYIGLVGSFTTSPGHKPMPGSDGDTCSKTTTGRLLFRSREFFDRTGTAFRIEISLPRYHGLGLYRHGAAEVTALGGFGLHSLTIFHNAGAVTVTTAEGTRLGGRFTAIFSGHRHFFRAYGAWRCRTLR